MYIISTFLHMVFIRKARVKRALPLQDLTLQLGPILVAHDGLAKSARAV